MGNIDDVSHSIGRIEAKVDTLLEAHERFSTKFDRHDDRLKTLEGHKSYILGIVAAITILFTVLVEFVKARILNVG